MIERDFNLEAGGWDAVPQRVRVAGAVADCIRDLVPWLGVQRLLDYGCGTGLVTLRLAALAREVVAVDSAPNMIARLKEKLAAANVEHVRAVVADVERGEPLPEGPFDAIICTQTLNHVRNPERLLVAFHAAMKVGGTVAIAEMDTGVVSSAGWSRERLRVALERAGFGYTGDRDALVIPVSTGDAESVPERRYYVATARRVAQNQL